MQHMACRQKHLHTHISKQSRNVPATQHKHKLRDTCAPQSCVPSESMQKRQLRILNNSTNPRAHPVTTHPQQHPTATQQRSTPPSDTTSSTAGVEHDLGSMEGGHAQSDRIHMYLKTVITHPNHHSTPHQAANPGPAFL